VVEDDEDDEDDEEEEGDDECRRVCQNAGLGRTERWVLNSGEISHQEEL
jgi:hypothetical protein